MSDRPVAITSEDYHSLWVNSKTLEMAEIDNYTPDPVGGMIERLPGTDGQPIALRRPLGHAPRVGLQAVQAIIPDYTLEQYKEGILAFQHGSPRPSASRSLFDPAMKPGSRRAGLRGARPGGLLTMRVRGALTLDPEDDSPPSRGVRGREAQHTTPYFQTPAVKFFVDGVIEGHTGYLEEPYADAEEYTGADPDYRSEPLWETGALAEAFAAVDAAGFQIHVHSIGDAATT